MSNVKTLIEQYLTDKQDAWAESTLASERHRLNSVAEVLDGDPDKLWKSIKGLAPYTRVTVWTRVTHFWGWAIEYGHVPGPNRYKQWKDKHGRQFRNAYTPKLPEITFAEAQARIQGLADSGVRRKALELLYGGLRYTESLTYDAQSKSVIGKGSKPRRVYVPPVEGEVYKGTYRTFLRRLSEVGLKPHTLRKLAATQLARHGVEQFDLCKVMGWVDPKTAMIYVAPLKEEEMERVFKQIQGVDINGAEQVPQAIPEPRKRSA
jgi:integrase